MLGRKKNQLKKEAKNFSFVSIVATGIDYVLLNTLIVMFHLPPLLANVISTTCSSVVSYKLNKKMVFEGRRYGRTRTYVLYILIIGFSIYIIQNAVIYLLAHRFDPLGKTLGGGIYSVTNWSLPTQLIATNIAKIIGGCLASLWNYLMLRHFVFIPETKKDELQPAQ